MIVLTELWPHARTDHQLGLRRQVAANEVLSVKNKIIAASEFLGHRLTMAKLLRVQRFGR
jgi:hypothetical protein